MLEVCKLTRGELSEACRLAGETCVRRLDQIARASDPSDQALQGLLGQMVREARTSSLEIGRDEDHPLFSVETAKSRENLQGFIREFFASVSRGFGEGLLDRDIALFFAESLEEEAARFYRLLAEHAREARTRTFFSDLSSRERGRLRFLREVVLQG